MNYDVIVLGTGGIGSATMFHLAKRGLRVLGLDRFPPAHDRGSSHGETRVIRRSYFEHPNYVPLLNRAYDLWHDLENVAAQPLLLKTGLVYFGNPSGPVLQGILSSSREHKLNVEEISLTDAGRRFAQFQPPPKTACLYEPDGGCLLVEDCVSAHLDQALRLGATHQHSETVLKWAASDKNCTVTTDRATYSAGGLVLSPGAWAAPLLSDLNLPLQVVRKHQHWFATGSSAYEIDGGCPCYFFETEDGYFYGCPGVSERGFKIAEHSGGETIEDPLTAERSEDPQDSKRINDFAARHLPALSTTRMLHKTCFYTVTPDEHFIVDRHPEHAAVSFAAGLSGHGFKFASVLGETLADLATDSAPHCDISFLACNRW